MDTERREPVRMVGDSVRMWIFLDDGRANEQTRRSVK